MNDLRSPPLTPTANLTHTLCLSFSCTPSPVRLHCLEFYFKAASCSRSHRNSLFNKACQVEFLVGRGETMQSSHARLPGSSLMCCHKACSWHRLNVQRDSELLLQHTEPWVLPLPTVLVHVSYCGVCALSESQRPDISAPSQRSTSISPGGKSGKIRRRLQLQSTKKEKKSPPLSSQYIGTVKGYWFFCQCALCHEFISQMKIRL